MHERPREWEHNFSIKRGCFFGVMYIYGLQNSLWLEAYFHRIQIFDLFIFVTYDNSDEVQGHIRGQGYDKPA